MPLDSFSPVAPARVRALVLPVGKIKRSRFLAFQNLLTEASDVHLHDLSDDERAKKTMFSPENFPQGVIFYEMTSSASSPSYATISPFETFREPMVVIGIGDAQEYLTAGVQQVRLSTAARRNEFALFTNALKDQYSRSLVQRILIFDEPDLEHELGIEDQLMLLPSAESTSLATVKRIADSITSSLLTELTSYAKSVQALPSIASPTIPQGQASQHHYPENVSPTLRRGQSQTSDSSSSPPAVENNDLHRLSLPAFSSTLSHASDPGRADSPTRTPAKTFDEIQVSSPKDKLRARPNSVMVPPREPSRDRVAVHGFGSDSFSEKTRRKGSGRVGVVISSLYIQAGQWSDGLKASVESALKARSFSDHVWHAKSLENIAVCMLLLAWAGMDFEIPHVCQPGSEYLPTMKTAAGQEPDSTPDVNVRPFSSTNAKASLLKTLSHLFPVLTHMILSVYSRAITSTAGEGVPEVILSECTIRLCKLLSVIHVSDGLLTDDGLSHLVLGTPFQSSSKLSTIRLGISPSRREISNILETAFPTPTALLLSAVDTVTTLAGIASVYSFLGMERKRAMAMQELLSALIPGLLQAKIRGAAEAGIHPSAGLAALAYSNNKPLDGQEKGLEDLLNTLCRIYGIPESQWTRSIGSDTLRGDLTNGKTEGKSTHLPDELIGNFILRSFGSINNKIDILRTCIYLCEALPDYKGILHYSSALLRTAGPGIAPSADSSDTLVNLEREEQVHIASGIAKTVADVKAAGLEDVEAEYWDEFLVRGLYILDPPSSSVLRPHRRADLGIAKVAPQKKDPFIHNPFLDTRKSSVRPNLLAAGDEREYVVSLQNPYDFEVEIQSLKLATDGHEMGISKSDFTLKPYRTQSFSLTGRCPKDGSIVIDGCIIKVKGCRERIFPIFSEAWAPKGDFKIKSIGLLKTSTAEHRESDNSTSSAGKDGGERSFPIPATVALTVIPEQPTVVISSRSVPEDALMLLEGESTTISVTLHNTSSTVSADFLHLSFYDSASTAMRDAMNQRGLPAAEMHEIEYQLTRLPAVAPSPNQPLAIAPGASETFHFQLLAKPGLTSVTIQFDYANMSTPHVNNEDSIFTKQLAYSVSVTVNASIQVQRLNIDPVPTALFSNHQSAPTNNEKKRSQELFKSIFGPTNASPSQDYCLIYLDLRNSWPSPLQSMVEVITDPEDEALNSSNHPLSAFSKSTNLIQPGQVARHVLLFPKIYIPNPHRRIHPLSTTHARQFVVSTDRVAPDIEAAARESFWFREALLSRVRARWASSSGNTLLATTTDVSIRTGLIDLRTGIRITPRLVHSLRLPDMEIKFTLFPCTPDANAPSRSRGKFPKVSSPSAYRVPVSTFFTLRTILHNRTPRSIIFPLLQLRPALVVDTSTSPHDAMVALDLAKRLAWSGALQRPLPPLGPGCSTSIDLPLCALCKGEFEVMAGVREVKPAEEEEEESSSDDDEGREKRRKRAEKEVDRDEFEGPPISVGCRSWTAGEACKIIAFDEDERESEE